MNAGEKHPVVAAAMEASNSFEHFQELVEHISDFLWEVDAHGLYTYASPSVEKILGYSRDEIVGKMHFYDLFAPALRDELKAAAFRVFEAKQPFRAFTNVNLHKNGRVVYLETSGLPVVSETGQLIGYRGADTDITLRKNMEEQLLRRGSELREAQRLAKVGSWTYDIQTKEVTWSDEMYRIHGLDRSSPPPSTEELARLFTVKSWEQLTTSIRESLRTGHVPDLELELNRPDGSQGWISTRGEVKRDASGRIVLLRGTIHDITERRQAEDIRMRLSGLLITAQEQERASIARELHDHINQRIALLAIGIQSCERSLAEEPGKTSEIHKLWELTTEIGRDVQALSHQLHSSQLQHLGLVPAINTLCQEFMHTGDMKAEFSTHGTPVKIEEDASLALFRVVQEGLRNAAKYSGARKVEVELTWKPQELSLTVSDDGVGFNPDAALGSGLGLISMHERMRLVGGTLSVRSSKGAGTCLTAHIRLGQPENDATTTISSVLQKFAPIRTLLVEDFEPFQRFVKRISERQPAFQLLSIVSDGLEAVNKAEELKPDIVLLDIGIPTLDGFEVARRLRDVSPDSKIIFLTQEMSLDYMRKAFDVGGRGYVVKNDAARELLLAISTVLRGERFVGSRLAGLNFSQASNE